MDSTGGGKPHLVDTTRPNPARVYDCLLGGKDNFAADRDMAETLTDPGKGYPGLRVVVRENREFVLKAVRWTVAVLGVTQVIDAGCGLPSRPSVHEAARTADPAARVAYVDRDPVVLSHVRAVEARGEGLAVAGADVSDPAAVLADPALLDVIDLAAPACVVLGGTLSAMDAQTARDTVAGFAAALAPGSAMVISCVSYASQEHADRMAALFGDAGTWRNHRLEDVASFFEAGGLRIVRGEVADVRCWPMLPSGGGRQACVLGGIGIRDLAASLANFDPRPHVLDMLAVFL